MYTADELNISISFIYFYIYTHIFRYIQGKVMWSGLPQNEDTFVKLSDLLVLLNSTFSEGLAVEQARLREEAAEAYECGHLFLNRIFGWEDFGVFAKRFLREMRWICQV